MTHPHQPLTPRPVLLSGFPLLLVGVGMWLMLAFAGSLLGNALAQAITGQSLQSLMTSNALDATGVWVVRLGLVISQVVAFAGAALVAARLSGRVADTLAWAPARPPALYGIAAFIGLVCIAVAGYFSISPESLSFPESLKPLEDALRSTEDQVREMLRQVLSNDLWANIIVIALAPAVCEELFFRGFMQRTLLKMMPGHAAVWVTAFIFSVIHFQVYGFFARWFLGVALGYLALWGRSLWPSIIAHFVINAVQAVAAYVAYTTASGEAWVEQESSIPYYVGLPALALCLTALWFYKRKAEEGARA